MVTDYSTWSHQQLHDAVMALDPAQINGAAYHWAQASLAWSQISTDVANHTKALMPSWTGPAANACYQYTSGLLRRNVQFQNAMTQSAPVLRTLAMNVYQARVQMPDPVDPATQAAAAGTPTQQQIEDYLKANRPASTTGSPDDDWAVKTVAQFAMTNPSSPAYQGTVTAAQTTTIAAHLQAVGVATTLASQFEQAHTQLQAINDTWRQSQGAPTKEQHRTKAAPYGPAGSSSSAGAGSIGSGPQNSAAYVPAAGQSPTSTAPTGPTLTATRTVQPSKPSGPVGPVGPPSGTGKAPKPVNPGGPPTGQQYPPPPSNPSPYVPPPYVRPPTGPSVGARSGDPGGTGLKDVTTPPSGVVSPSPSQTYVPQGGGWAPSGNSGGWNSTGPVGSWGTSGDGVTGGITGGSAGSRRVASAYGEGEGEGMMGAGAGGGGDKEQRGQRPGYLVNDDDEYWTGSKVKRAAPPGGVIE
jgi:hypothetical protein